MNEKTNNFWSWFGGSIFGIIILLLSFLIQYFYSCISDIRADINKISNEIILKQEYNDKMKTMWQHIGELKTLKEKIRYQEEQLTNLKEENKNLNKEMQLLREKIIILENKKKSLIPS